MHRLRSLGMAALFTLVSLGGAVGLPHAGAANACFSDPIVVLSNGIQVDLHATFNNGTLSTIQQVNYVLSGPPLPAKGTPPPGAILSGAGWYTLSYPDGSGSFSTFTYSPTDNVGNYDADITVQAAASTPMTAYMDWLTGNGTPTPTAPGQGHGGQDLHIHMHVA